ncbi:MAG TPA: GTPase HflX [Spirochaetota bacterium]|nr:GTPase HflX [Spirochaetota bacterium]HNU92568.1 GTPase HflX [Spirochaetota bacterium]HPV98064.1 GTPase HflX [Spirochaetota bacterium]
MDASVNRIPSSADERSLLVAIRLAGQDEDSVEQSLDELTMLVDTAGAVIVDRIILRRQSFDAAHLIGRGQIERISSIIAEKDIRLIVFDLNAVKPAQIRNLETIFKCRVVGRTEVILDIFARRARSAESKIQVELAMLRYILPRLKGLGGVLSRLGGGIGTRGPGEKMLETDRRHILRRIAKLNDRLEEISEHRKLLRRGRSGQVRGAVAGYTNAGKSTLLNLLARDDLFVEDRLFATLDAYTRIVYLDDYRKTLITDTVGFIDNLPANLVESFKSTLEEIRNAHFIIHVVDVTARNLSQNMRTVEKELAALECSGIPTVLFFNKCDLLPSRGAQEALLDRFPGAIAGSARTGEGVDALKKAMAVLYDSALALKP